MTASQLADNSGTRIAGASHVILPYLAIDDVTIRYGSVEILRNFSLGVAAGNFVAVLGSSGCGKTTLLRAISGFVAPATGRIRLGGVDITDAPAERRHTAMVFQSYALWPHMTVFQNIAYGLRVRRHSRSDIVKKVGRLLALLRLDGLAERNVTELSGGQRQRVALGRALAIDPAVLLLDEPLSNLDARIRLELRTELRAVQKRLGITALHVTHDREEAMVLADRIVVMAGGRIEQEGTPEDVYHCPASPFVASFMGADNVIGIDIRSAGDWHIEARLAGAAAIARLPFGRDGVHLAQGLRDGPAEAHFHAEAVQLAAVGEAAPADSLLLSGSIDEVSYPGGVWRYAVRSGGHRFIIDSDRRYADGAAVAIVVPAKALHLFPRP